MQAHTVYRFEALLDCASDWLYVVLGERLWVGWLGLGIGDPL